VLKKGTAGAATGNCRSLTRETAGAATGNCRCLKREQLADSLRPTLHIGNGGVESWDRKLLVLKRKHPVERQETESA
jgi:hypothetical protein